MTRLRYCGGILCCKPTSGIGSSVLVSPSHPSPPPASPRRTGRPLCSSPQRGFRSSPLCPPMASVPSHLRRRRLRPHKPKRLAGTPLAAVKAGLHGAEPEEDSEFLAASAACTRGARAGAMPRGDSGSACLLPTVVGRGTACSPFVIAGDGPVSGQSGRRIGPWPQRVRGLISELRNSDINPVALPLGSRGSMQGQSEERRGPVPDPRRHRDEGGEGGHYFCESR